MENIAVARKILHALDRPESLLRFVTDRPAHDRRYALNCTKVKSDIGWEPHWDFERGLAETIRWYQTNSAWLEKTRNGEYNSYFERHYLHRESAAGQVQKSARA